MRKIQLGENKQFVLASNNAHKIAEIKAILSDFGITLMSMKEAGIEEDIVEDGTTFEENSYIKAKYIFDHYGMQAIADDSGLEVAYLDGAPGIYSARFAGEQKSDADNNELLLKKLEGVDNRAAKFVSVITMVYCDSKGEEQKIHCRGEVEGTILTSPRGSGGFGYDPLFSLGEKTMAELSPEEKNKVSHRANALELLREALVGSFA